MIYSKNTPFWSGTIDLSASLHICAQAYTHACLCACVCMCMQHTNTQTPHAFSKLFSWNNHVFDKCVSWLYSPNHHNYKSILDHPLETQLITNKQKTTNNNNHKNQKKQVVLTENSLYQRRTLFQRCQRLRLDTAVYPALWVYSQAASQCALGLKNWNTHKTRINIITLYPWLLEVPAVGKAYLTNRLALVPSHCAFCLISHTV